MKKYSLRLQTFLLAIFFPVIFLTACHENDTEVFKFTNASIDQGIKTIKSNTTENLYELREKTMDPKTHEVASIWFPAADRIKKMTDDINFYLNLTKRDILDSSKKINTDSLSHYLNQYVDSVEKINDELGATFKIQFETLRLFDSSVKKNEASLFRNTTKYEAYTRLNLIRNNITTLENRLTAFCNSKVGYNDDSYDKFSCIVGQNKGHLKAGEVLEITAGVGAWSTSAAPTFQINKEILKPNENGVAIKKIKVDQKSGEYSVPIIIDFTNTAGVKEKVKRTITYTIDP